MRATIPGRAMTAAVAAVMLAAGVARCDDRESVRLREQVRAWRTAHAADVLRELAALVALPNVATDLDDMERNARLLTAMMERRGFAVRRLAAAGGPPVLVAERTAPGADRLLTFYAHYDGQPAPVEGWTSPPFAPTLRAGTLEEGAEEVSLEGLSGDVPGSWRLYGRSTSDDKGPIVALLAAVDALDALGVVPTASLRLFLDGEEERGSPRLAQILREHAAGLEADLWLFCDGPVHQTRRPQVVFGVRGVVSVEITAYGPAAPLHSGHYGGWAPDPGMELVHLLASMRDRDGDLAVPGLAEAVRPLGEAERVAVATAPPVEQELGRTLALAWTEGAPATLAERITRPAMNLLGFRAGQVGDRAANVIGETASAVVGFRLVPELTPERVRQAVESHIRGQGYRVVEAEPTLDERRSSRVVRLAWREGYPALRTPMDHAGARAVLAVAEGASEQPVVATPTLGGSLPLHLFEEILGATVLVVPIVNHDNRQHGADENLRLQNLWDGVELYAALMVRTAQIWDAGGGPALPQGADGPGAALQLSSSACVRGEDGRAP